MQVEKDFDFQAQKGNFEKNSILKKDKFFKIAIGTSLGISLSISNYFISPYLYRIQSRINVEEFQRKEIIMNVKSLKDNPNDLILEKEYDTFYQIKKDYLNNLIEQVSKYDNIYLLTMKSLDEKLLGLDDVLEIRKNIFNYKKEINSHITFINDINSLDDYKRLTIYQKNFLKEIKNKYLLGEMFYETTMHDKVIGLFDKYNSQPNTKSNSMREDFLHEFAKILNKNQEFKKEKILKL